MNKKSIVGVIVAVVAVAIIILVAYSNIQNTDNLNTKNEEIQQNTINETEGKNITIELKDGVGISGP